MPREYVWIQTGIPPKCKLSPWEKQRLKALADQFVENFYKPALVKPPPEPRFNYIVDIHTKWHGAYLQFISKYACPGPNALSRSSRQPSRGSATFARTRGVSGHAATMTSGWPWATR